MYQPPHFAVTEEKELEAFIEAHPLGLLISNAHGTIEANPVPFLPKRTDGGLVLLAHVARANEQWKMLGQAPSVLVVFQGEQAYVTPSWYPSKTEHHKVVPTWNYLIVQARGEAIVHDDADWLHAQITALTNRHEAGRQTPWAVGDAPERFIDAQKRGIVGIEIRVSELSGKWKMSQNRPVADREGVRDGYLQDGKHEMAGLVTRHGNLTNERSFCAEGADHEPNHRFLLRRPVAVRLCGGAQAQRTAGYRDGAACAGTSRRHPFALGPARPG